VKATSGLRAALIVLVLIAIAPEFAIVVQASASEQQARLERLIDGARQVLAAIAYSPAVYGDDHAACAAYMKRLQTQYPLAYGTVGVLDAGGNLTRRQPAKRCEQLGAQARGLRELRRPGAAPAGVLAARARTPQRA
jgi:hypothetical protein